MNPIGLVANFVAVDSHTNCDSRDTTFTPTEKQEILILCAMRVQGASDLYVLSVCLYVSSV
jgi:hypothetical protein